MQKQLTGLLIAVVFTLAGLTLPQWLATPTASAERVPALVTR